MESNELEYRLNAIELLVNQDVGLGAISEAIAQIRCSLDIGKEKEAVGLHRIYKSHVVTVSLRDHAGYQLMVDLIEHPIYGRVCSYTGSFRHPIVSIDLIQYVEPGGQNVKIEVRGDVEFPLIKAPRTAIERNILALLIAVRVAGLDLEKSIPTIFNITAIMTRAEFDSLNDAAEAYVETYNKVELTIDPIALEIWPDRFAFQNVTGTMEKVDHKKIGKLLNGFNVVRFLLNDHLAPTPLTEYEYLFTSFVAAMFISGLYKTDIEAILFSGTHLTKDRILKIKQAVENHLETKHK